MKSSKKKPIDWTRYSRFGLNEGMYAIGKNPSMVIIKVTRDGMFHLKSREIPNKAPIVWTRTSSDFYQSLQEEFGEPLNIKDIGENI